MARTSKASTADTIKGFLFILAGTAAFLLKPHYNGPMAEQVQSYAGNFSASFSVYFLSSLACARIGQNRFSAMMAALLAVEAFEITDGFGVLSNVFDPLDLLVNAAGVATAFAVDHLTRSGNRF